MNPAAAAGMTVMPPLLPVGGAVAVWGAVDVVAAGGLGGGEDPAVAVADAAAGADDRVAIRVQRRQAEGECRAGRARIGDRRAKVRGCRRADNHRRVAVD